MSANILWQARVLDECAALEERIQRHASWIGTPKYKSLDLEEQIDLALQLVYMRAYRDVLDRRIERFK